MRHIICKEAHLNITYDSCDFLVSLRVTMYEYSALSLALSLKTRCLLGFLNIYEDNKQMVYFILEVSL